jgi:hypothetical protein
MFIILLNRHFLVLSIWSMLDTLFWCRDIKLFFGSYMSWTRPENLTHTSILARYGKGHNSWYQNISFLNDARVCVSTCACECICLLYVSCICLCRCICLCFICLCKHACVWRVLSIWCVSGIRHCCRDINFFFWIWHVLTRPENLTNTAILAR